MSENPSNPKGKGNNLPPGYQPMSQGIQRLEVPERPGFHRRWFRGDASRIARAQRAGYVFVNADDVDLNNVSLGGDAKDSGNTDLGTRVSVISGDDLDATGQPGRMYLMECPIELYEVSRGYQADRNDSIAAALRGGDIGKGENGERAIDGDKRYIKGDPSDLFIPNKRKRSS